MRRLEHCNIVKLKYFFYSSGDKVSPSLFRNSPTRRSYSMALGSLCRESPTRTFAAFNYNMDYILLVD